MILSILLCLTPIIICLAYYGSKLNKMPTITGPINLPFIGILYKFLNQTSAHHTLLELHNKYGHTFRGFLLNHLRIVTKDPDLLELVSTNQNTLDKSGSYTFMKPWLGNGLVTSSGKKWQTHRKIITPSYHFINLQQFVEIFDFNADIFIKQLRKEVDNDVDIMPFMLLCTLDIICESAMGRKINAQLEGSSKFVKATQSITSIYIRRIFSIIKSIDIFYKFCNDFREEQEELKILHTFTLETIKERRKELEWTQHVDTLNKDNFLDMLLKSTHKGPPLTNKEIKDQVNTFMFAGHDTTGSALSFTMYLISNHSDVWQKLHLEQVEIFQDTKRPTTYDNLLKMKYLELVIKESMRMFPPIPFIGRYVKADIHYKGNIIPKGTFVNMNIFALHQDPDNYPEPEKFQPERFLPDGDHVQKKNPCTYLPFIAGMRNCVGQKFAMLEMKTVLSKILRNFYVLPTVPKHIPKISSEIALHSSNGLFIRLKNIS